MWRLCWNETARTVISLQFVLFSIVLFCVFVCHDRIDCIFPICYHICDEMQLAGPWSVGSSWPSLPGCSMRPYWHCRRRDRCEPAEDATWLGGCARRYASSTGHRPHVSAPSTWNSLSAHIRSVDTLSTFKRHPKFDLFQSALTVSSHPVPAPRILFHDFWRYINL